MDRLLTMFLGRLIRRGSFTVTTARGKTYTFGDGSGPQDTPRTCDEAGGRSCAHPPKGWAGHDYETDCVIVPE